MRVLLQMSPAGAVRRILWLRAQRLKFNRLHVYDAELPEPSSNGLDMIACRWALRNTYGSTA